MGASLGPETKTGGQGRPHRWQSIASRPSRPGNTRRDPRCRAGPAYCVAAAFSSVDTRVNIAVIGVAIITAVGLAGDSITAMFTRVSTELNAAAQQ